MGLLPVSSLLGFNTLPKPWNSPKVSSLIMCFNVTELSILFRFEAEDLLTGRVVVVTCKLN